MNLRCSDRLFLFGCVSMLPGFVLLSATRTMAMPVTQPLAQVAAKPTPQSNSLPWLLGGSAIAVGGGLMGLYKLGQRTGRQDANLDRAMAGYRTLVDIDAVESKFSTPDLAAPDLAAPDLAAPDLADSNLADPDLAEAAAAVFHSVADPEDDLPAAQQVFPIAPEMPPALDLTADFPVPGEPVMAIPVPPLPIDPSIVVPPAPAVVMPYAIPREVPREIPREAPREVQPIAPQPIAVQAMPQVTVAQALVPQAMPQPAIVTTQSPVSAAGSIMTTARSTSIQGELVQPVGATAPGALVESRSRLPQVTVVENLLTDLRSTDAERRKKAIWNLGQCGDTRAVQPLVDLMLDADSRQRSLILSALSEIGVRTLKPMSRALAISLQDENPEVRKNAIRDMTRVYDLIAQISQLVYRATEDPDDEVRDTANWAMKQLNRMRPAESPTLSKSVSPPESLPS